ncbi:MAG: deoxyribonuclease V [Balneolaceae bacterium]|nr:deoxyribonuclease V [Balneolaceae bacterium]
MTEGQKYDYENVTPKQAIEIQKDLRSRIALTPLDREAGIIAGADLSFDRGSPVVHAGIVILSVPELELKAHSLVSAHVEFPYIPGLLAFRELPALMKAWSQCECIPDVLILDGHGIAHPRRMGLATHFGIVADKPTIGCAKNVLMGDYQEPAPEKGAYSELRENGEQIGIVLRSRSNVNPIFISPGHRVTFEDTYRVIMQALGTYKLPETTRQAHRLVNELRRGDIQPGYAEY